jgi:phosphoribosylformylglycinamidine cyclo-ligase
MYNPEKPYKQQILNSIRETWKSSAFFDVEKTASYPILKKTSLIEVFHTDGIGTKGIFHWKKRTFASAVQDAMAMNLNDLAMMRATPQTLQNHLYLPKDDHEAVLEIIRELVKSAKKFGIMVTGGETSIHNDMEGMDLSITMSAYIRRKTDLVPNKVQEGDTIIGIPSTGLHSNGFTKVRELYKRYQPVFVIPTAIYLLPVTEIREMYQINGMMHITGGAFTKLKDILTPKLDINILQEQSPHKIFWKLRSKGISSEEMYRTFNCGIGFVFSVPPEQAKTILSKYPTYHRIGHVSKGHGNVNIKSVFDGEEVRY